MSKQTLHNFKKLLDEKKDKKEKKKIKIIDKKKRD